MNESGTLFNNAHLSIFAAMKKAGKTKHLRVHNMAFKLNDNEYRAVKRYLDKYKITNKSRWCRETLLLHILKTLEADYPTLFKESEMRR